MIHEALKFFLHHEPDLSFYINISPSADSRTQNVPDEVLR